MFTNRFLSFFLFWSWTILLSAQSFNDVATQHGIDVLNTTIDNWGSGLSFYDFNQDGWDDLSFARENSSPVFYENVLGTFQEFNLSLNALTRAKMLLWVDYDNDGNLDIFLTNRDGKNYLYRNQGNFTFTDVTLSAGLFTGPAKNYGAAFGDYDKDGYLDLYICRYYHTGGNSGNSEFVNMLYHNNGDGTFTDLTFAAGVSDSLKQSFLPVWFDYNNDTWPDLYVVNDKIFDGVLYENNGDGTFSDVTMALNLMLPNSNLMTGSVADFNNDQFLDLFLSNTAEAALDAPRLYENITADSFVNVYSQYLAGMDNTSWGGLWVDYDNNTKQDLYVATDFLDPSLPSVANYFYINNYPQPFQEDNSMFNGTQSFSSHAVAKGDFDNNGFYDIAVYNEAPDFSNLWQNSGNAQHYIKITLEGTVSNKFAIGSWIRVFVNGQQYSQYTMCGENYLGQNSQHYIFGLNSDTIVDSVHIEYLSGVVDKYYNLTANQSYHFVEGANTSLVNIELQGSNPFCEGDSVVLSVPNMLAYYWSTGDTTQTIVVSDEGTYSMSALDSNGLVRQSNTLFLAQVASPTIASQVKELSCSNSSDGAAYLSVLNEGQTYDITWSNSTSGDTLFADSSGFYGYTYTDSFECSLAGLVEIDAPFPLNIQVDIEPQDFEQQGSIQVAVNGGVPPYTILLDGIDIGNQLIAIDSGSYELLVTDSNACQELKLVIVPFQDTALTSSIYAVSNENVKISPNPFNQEILISIPPLNCTLNGFRLVDVFGKTIIKKGLDNVQALGNNNWRLPVTMQLTQGIYYLEVATSCRTSQYKLMKK